MIADLANRGLVVDTGGIGIAANTMDRIHKAAVEKSMHLVHEFVGRTALSPAQLGEAAKQRLDNLGVFLIGQVPSSKLDAFHLQQFQNQYTAVFTQRSNGALSLQQQLVVHIQKLLMLNTRRSLWQKLAVNGKHFRNIRHNSILFTFFWLCLSRPDGELKRLSELGK
ncbi:MAG TPA: hypothetical protein VFT64_11930 [Rickettsiales bacterium]|nr:hypothetical protein [Rickettsiales bacterium]